MYRVECFFVARFFPSSFGSGGSPTRSFGVAFLRGF